MSSSDTPMMQQWHACKKKAKDALLLFHLGDFYEAFYEDAKIIAKEINLTLTQRQGIPMCGAPLHACDSYIDKLLAKGYKVAIADQVENPKEVKGIVKRELTRIITPGTLVTSNLLQDKSNNFFLSLSQIGSLYGIAFLDLTTAEFSFLELDNRADLLDELCRITPSEILVSKKFQSAHSEFFSELSHHFPFVISTKEEWFYDYKTSLEALISHFSLHTLDGMECRENHAATSAAGALLIHLQDELNINVSHIRTLKKQGVEDYLSIDHSTMNNLEILHSSKQSYTLVSLLDKTSTAMGGRLLKKWIQKPLLSVEKIRKRQDGIEEFLENIEISLPLTTHLEKVRDLERLIMKISSHYASPRDLLALRSSLQVIPKIKQLLSPFKKELLVEALSQLVDVSPLTRELEKALSDQPPLRVSEGGVFQTGYDQELDHLRSIGEKSRSWIANYQNTLRLETGIKTLKVGFTKAFGYYIDITKTHSDKVPLSFQRRQTLVSSERFITEELKTFEHKILSAESQIQAIEQKLFDALKATISSYADPIDSIAKAISSIDLLFSLSKVAREYNYIRPIVDESDTLHVIEGRHPVLEKTLGRSQFISNDTLLNKNEQLFVITGPNMAGKSTYIRQVALLVILAQMGSFIPAQKASIGIIDKLFSRIGASDDLSRGQSTFMVEMAETAHILNSATSSSLIILDEIGRGTSTYDGISIAWAVAEYLLTTENKRAKTLFATHYLEMTKLAEKFPSAINYQVAIKENSKGISFLHKIEKGSADKSYGIHVAKLAGLPEKALIRAEKMLLSLEKKQKNPLSQKESSSQMLLFPPNPSHPLLEEIKRIDCNQLSPLEALQKLFSLQKKLSS